jgi:hypothetical protein
MTAQKIVTGGLAFEAQRNGDVKVAATATYTPVVSHLDTIRLSYWLLKTYVKAAAKRSEGPKS